MASVAKRLSQPGRAVGCDGQAINLAPASAFNGPKSATSNSWNKTALRACDVVSGNLQCESKRRSYSFHVRPV